MSGERDLDRLLAGMSPRLNPGTWLFCSIEDRGIAAGLQPLAMFQEAEGLTVVVEAGAAARAGLSSDFGAAWITLEIHSDLAAVGFLARIATALAAQGIPCNPISAYRHDHLFVPFERSADAMRALAELQDSAGK